MFLMNRQSQETFSINLDATFSKLLKTSLTNSKFGWLHSTFFPMIRIGSNQFRVNLHQRIYLNFFLSQVGSEGENVPWSCAAHCCFS